MDQILNNLQGKRKNYLTRKRILGLFCGLVLAIIILNVDKKLWWPLELETINGRNTSTWVNNTKLTTEKIVVILFDDKTRFLLRLNGWPIKDFEKRGRLLIKEAIEKLESSGVRAIGINLNLSAPSVTQTDEELAMTISKFKNIIIADSIDSFQSSPINSILKSATGIGYGELYADYDKIVHKIKLTGKGYQDLPSFSYALFKISSKKDVNPHLKAKNEFYLRYPNTSFKSYSFIDLIQGKIKPFFLKDKIIILGIGLKSKLLRDQLLTPFDKNLITSDSEVQAIALANLLNNSYLTKPSSNEHTLLFILFSMFLGMLFSSIPTFRGLTLSIALLTSLIILSQVAYSYFHIVVEIVPFSFSILGNFVIGSLTFLQLNLQEQNIELEASKIQLENKNIQLTNALSELNKRVEELKEVRKQLSNRSEEERKRIARELHDDSLARITDLKRHIESILNSHNLPIQEKRQLGVSIQILDNVTHEIRRIINALRPSMLDNVLGLIPAIENLLDELTKRSNYKIQTKLTTSLSKLRLSEEHEINLYRIIQEALNNAFKHSYATKVNIFVEEQPGQILFLISDNGVGISNNVYPKGFGFIDMKERAELIGAAVQYLNKPQGSGVTLEITLPYSKEEHKKKEEVTNDRTIVLT